MCHLSILLANYLDPSKSSCSVIAAKVSEEFGISVGKTAVSYVIKPLRRYEEYVPSPSPPPLTYDVSPLKHHHLSLEYKLYPPPPPPPPPLPAPKKRKKKLRGAALLRRAAQREEELYRQALAEAAKPQEPPLDSQPIEPPPLNRERVLPLSKVELKHMKFAFVPAGQSRKAKRKALKKFTKQRKKVKSVCIKGTTPRRTRDPLVAKRSPLVAKRSGVPQKTKSVLPPSILDPVPR